MYEEQLAFQLLPFHEHDTSTAYETAEFISNDLSKVWQCHRLVVLEGCSGPVGHFSLVPQAHFIYNENGKYNFIFLNFISLSIIYV